MLDYWSYQVNHRKHRRVVRKRLDRNGGTLNAFKLDVRKFLGMLRTRCVTRFRQRQVFPAGH